MNGNIITLCHNILKNPTLLLQKLLQCESITPLDNGVQTLIESWLKDLGFDTEVSIFGEVSNLYATRRAAEENASPHFLFAGHSDVVPTPQLELWKHPPFAGIIENNYIYGRGAQDMKGGIACFIAAVARLERDQQVGTISLAITGDEEGPGINGTVKLMQHMFAKGVRWDIAIVGEPTCKEKLGDTIKIGRRGSLSGVLEAHGISGHVAYQDKAENAAKKILPYIVKLSQIKLDNGSKLFQPSNLEITQILSGGEVNNIIPGSARAQFNIRFNDLWNVKKLKNHILNELNIKNDGDIIIKWGENYSESFITENDLLVESLQEAILKSTNINAKLDTGGGTSDARFIKNYCPVVEFGLCGTLMHKVNEAVNINELEKLTEIYYNFLKNLDRQ